MGCQNFRHRFRKNVTHWRRRDDPNQTTTVVWRGDFLRMAARESTDTVADRDRDARTIRVASVSATLVNRLAVPGVRPHHQLVSFEPRRVGGRVSRASAWTVGADRVGRVGRFQCPVGTMGLGRRFKHRAGELVDLNYATFRPILAPTRLTRMR